MTGWATIYSITTNALQRHTQEMARLQEQASSGRRVVHASDDPSDAYWILGLRREQADMDAYLENLRNTELGLESMSSILQDTTGSLTRVAQLLTQASSSTYSDEQRQAMAMEVDQILEHVLGLANHDVLGKYMFGGTLTDGEPFEITRQADQITEVTYQGSGGELEVPVAPGVMYDSTMVGSDVFGMQNRQDPVFSDQTGLAPGVGTSNIRGYAELEVVHTQTQYYDAAIGDNGGINLQAGSLSAAGDTVLGNATHTVTIDADTQQAWLDGGPRVAYSGSTDNLKLTNVEGDAVYIDTTALTLGAGRATVNVLSYGKASIDGGQTYVPVELGELTNGFAATNAQTGEVLYVDAQNAKRTGTEAIRVPGTHDVFGVLIEMRDVLASSAEYSQAEKTRRLEGLQASLDEVMGGVTQNLTAVGSRLQALDMLGQRLSNLSGDLDAEASSLGDADIVQVAIDLTRAQNFYEATLMSVSKLLSVSLLDFLT